MGARVCERFSQGVSLFVQAVQLYTPPTFSRTPRAEVRTHQDNAVYNFSLTDNMGQIPGNSTLRVRQGKWAGVGLSGDPVGGPGPCVAAASQQGKGAV